ncbi:Predicted arabinose efflux permease, MFS family [Halorubrum aquaticum]|uniref:Predicted arabinose efflux permease, MFS family n=1 Tax=Halorubrum aquaticum TaxID=387340 RepID=A0A1I3BAX5_9EURY|nr:MFS transporter [Halorubrum aquaticum]SFH59465.1 Predicted arabinose efflux permease, MFS family [Halorubrum aquaticum]
MSKSWLYAWGLASIAFGGASLVVPLYVVDLGGSPATLGTLAAVASAVGVPGALVFGRLADRTGRRRWFVLAAIGLLAATLAVLPALESIPAVIVANGVVWFAFASATPVVTLLAVAGAPEDAWSERIGELNEYQGIGWALGLLLGTVWIGIAVRLGDASGIRSFLSALAVLAAAGLVASVRWLPADAESAEVSPRRLRRALRRANRFSVRAATFPFAVGRADYRRLHPERSAERFTPTLALYFVAVTLFFTGFSAFFAPLPAYLTDVGVGSEGVFALYLVSSVASAVLFERAGELSGRRDPMSLQVAGLAVRGVAFPLVAVVGAVLGASVLGLVAAGVVFGVIGFTWAVIAVTAGTLVTRLSPTSIRGEALGVYAALSALAGAGGSVIGGALAATSYELGFGVAGGLVLVGAAGVLRLRRRVRREDEAGRRDEESRRDENRV